MNVHKNARLTVHSRAEVVRRVRAGQAPRSRGGKSRSPLEPHGEWLKGLVAQEPNLTLVELEQRILEGLGLKITERSIGRFLPFQAFGHYPTGIISPDVRLTLAPGATLARLADFLRHPLFSELIVPEALAAGLLALATSGEVTVSQAATVLGTGEPAIARAAGLLAKMELLELTAAPATR